jgi:cysteinyl-tRNA synthetase
VLGLLRRGVEAGGPPAAVERLVAERTDARARRDWRRSDELRAEIQRLGWLVEDTPGGPRLTRTSG